MTSAFFPEGGYPRLIRNVTNLPKGVVAEYEKEFNLLKINRELFDKLSVQQQNAVVRTHHRWTVVTTITIEDNPDNSTEENTHEVPAA